MKPTFTKDVLAQAGTFVEAIERTYRVAGLCDKEVAASLGLEYCHFQRMFRDTGGRHFPPHLIPEIMEISGNIFALEWLAWRMGMTVYPQDMINILHEIRAALKGEGDMVKFARALEAVCGER